ncbi:hypothetical protein MIND_00762300 [Mycena indigotica]|uniref:Uncharacterized protein n=1 Tax=Mycena indigotica TaxID=2126181 RepID=A0A8H6SPF3_9AGAR|nr:uncharacterized protein MIND_00762300 [Mycena indigotica]KAF7301962.1 hypothetical protein MIND_00762300 [Mycena indigotica]
MLSALFGWLWPPKTTPPPPGMHVVPCTGVDLVALDLVLTTAFIVDAKLDPRKLEETLLLLISRKFPRAGARLALRNGKYEYQIPLAFDAQTPAAVFTSETCPELYDASDRPSPAKLWSKANQPFACGYPDMVPFIRGPTCPKGADDCLKSGAPLLHVHVSVFEDLTFIGVTASHVLFDAMGTKTFLHAWTRAISGERIEDIPGMDWDAQPFATFSQPAPAGWVQRGFFDLGLISKASFIARMVLSLMRDPKDHGMYVCVPKPFLEAEKQKIMDELKEEGSKEWVSSSDVLVGWWLKTGYKHRQDLQTPFHLHLPVNVRKHGIFSTASGDIGGPFINNAVMGISIPPFTIGDLHTMSLRDIALRIRRAILAYNNDLEGIKNDVSWRCANPSMMVFPCPPGAEYSFQTNWRTAGFGQLDFSGALVAPKKQARVIWVTGHSTSGNPMPMRGSGVMLFENDDVVWMGQMRTVGDWEDIRRAGALKFID